MSETGSPSEPISNQGGQTQPAASFYNPQYLSWICLFLAGASLAIGYTVGDIWYVNPVIFLLIFAQIFSDMRHWYWVASLVFLIFTIIAAGGFFLEINFPWLLVGLILALFAWDLSSFESRLNKAGRIVSWNTQIIKHLTRLLIVGGAGLLLALAAQSFEIQLEFGWLVLLGLISFLGLSYIITKILRTS